MGGISGGISGGIRELYRGDKGCKGGMVLGIEAAPP